MYIFRLSETGSLFAPDLNDSEIIMISPVKTDKTIPSTESTAVAYLPSANWSQSTSHLSLSEKVSRRLPCEICQSMSMRSTCPRAAFIQ